MRRLLCLVATIFVSTSLAHGQTLNFGDAIDRWSVACKADVDAHCSDIRPGSGGLGACLEANGSQSCRQASAEFQANMDARFGAQARAPEVCRSDVKRLCPNFNAGGARILRCLMKPQNFKAATRSCKETLAAAGWLDEVSIRGQ